MTSDNSENNPVDPETGAQGEAAGESLPPLDSEDTGVVQEAESIVEEASATDQLAERTADLQRLQAEFTNYRRRVERDKQVIKETARASVITELIGILDDLDRARAHGDLESGPLRALADKLNTTLTGLGLTDFGNEGDDFDPALHEAVQHEGEGHDPVLGTVMRKGYKLGDRVLRTAMVAVTDRVGDKPADGSEQEAK
ncbi:nucleotide exchange factor GrpE [Rhodococcus sp. WS1]|uniref:Protein GrpE n=3 Tax=Rhodococcus erythropolis group TaxID=2840174 RepID=A0A0C2ZXD0_RHOER|nr:MULTISPECIES: nucleotide exchange factor GrpE [Rhodococcus]EQM30442.1 molecular chaperone GrpE [Rhodococcus erythropolis DN1]ERB54351.1 molecular chaperone GrpE [Rhodococcus sp. P27]MCD2153628.1 nucleotide exchange factor GrpE [Rhodococcus cerastii]NRH34403.1 nucleotide exchange factor GrpE [Rhodococcus sp. MS13]AGT91142.1 GrpE protein [Rhodococcus erythropolis CCM2595]